VGLKRGRRGVKERRKARGEIHVTKKLRWAGARKKFFGRWGGSGSEKETERGPSVSTTRKSFRRA